MKILWISNITFPAVSRQLGLPEWSSGSWLVALAEQLAQQGGIELNIVSVDTVKGIKYAVHGNISFYIIERPGKKSNSQVSVDIWRKIIDEVKPDIVHLNGSEYGYGLSLIKVFPNLKYVLSIQGLVSIVERYYFSGLGIPYLLRHPLFFLEMLRNLNNCHKAAIREIQYLKTVKYIIGRTFWDKAHILSINPKLEYFFCNENLRSIFYSTRWDITAKESFRIFVSQASSSIKGVHIALKAFGLLKRKYPQLRIYISGSRPVPTKNIIRELFRKITYPAYLKRRIIELQLQGNVIFTGNLSAEEMLEQYKKAHVFVLPSTIENSPNSLGEAQLVGTPAVCAYVGGVPDMARHRETALLYQAEEYELLAAHISEIFESDHLAQTLSANGRIAAMKRHEPVLNTITLTEIYKRILN